MASLEELRVKKLTLFSQADRAFCSGKKAELAELEKQMLEIDEQIDELGSK